MTQTRCRRIAIMTAFATLVGCQAGAKPTALAKSDAPKVESAAPAAKESTSAAQVKKADHSTSKPQGPIAQTVFYRADVKPPTMPRVALSKTDEAACKVKVGDVMPTIELPKIGGSGAAKLSDLFGKKATVVLFWKGDRRMSQQQLSDIAADVVEPFGKQGVAVVGIAVDDSAENAESAFKKAGANFPTLHDADGKAFARVGDGRFPRTYVLDSSGKIVWFDIEYSLATRRELHQALRVLAGGK